MNNKKIICLSGILLTLFVLTACGNLSDPDSVWNRTREELPNDISNGTGAMTFTPGVFEGTGDGGFGGSISVAITIDTDGSITDVEVTDHNETPEFADRAFGYLIPGVLRAQSANIDAVSNATETSDAFVNAVRNALDQAGGTPAAETGTANHSPGVFEGTGEGGFGGSISVTVTIDADGLITDIEVTNHNETPEFADRAFGYLIPNILAAQSADVDAVTNATETSDAFLRAVEDALSDAQ